jgi:hypothetical protein
VSRGERCTRTARLFYDNHEIRAALVKRTEGAPFARLSSCLLEKLGKTDRLRHRLQHRNLERNDVYCREIMGPLKRCISVSQHDEQE